MNRRIFLLCLAMVLVLCMPAQARVITDMAGHRVEVPETITRVFATAPPATLMVYAVAPDTLIGLNAPLKAAARPYLSPGVLDLPVMGGWFGQGRMANLESLLAAKPQVVVAFRWRDRTVNWKIEETLEPLGLPVVTLVINGVEDYPAVFELLGELLGRQERGKALAAYARQTLEAMAQLRAKLPPEKVPVVYYAEGPRGLQTECDNSFHVQLIKICGGRNAHHCLAQTIYGMEKVSLEQVLAYRPQVILSANRVFLAEVRADPRWAGAPAIKQGRVYAIPTLPINWFDRPPSFMGLLGAHWLAAKLHPDLYLVDMTAKTREFFKLFLGVDIEDAEAWKLLGR